MAAGKPQQPTWSEILKKHAPVMLPAAHDALTAKLIEKSGFKAYQMGGFASVGARHAYPDIDLCHYGEERAALQNIIEASHLPVMVDADDCYGDVKNVTRTIQGYESMGVAALFFEDQVAPKRCGHMDNKEVIPTEQMVAKVRAAVGARSSRDFFIIARTDARAQYGLDEAIRRGEEYLKAGADGLFIEAPRTEKEFEIIGSHFKGTPLLANMFEGGGKSPVLTPTELHGLGFAMVTYPTSLLFSVTRTIVLALQDMLAERPLDKGRSVDMDEFEDLVDKEKWTELEKKYGKG